MTNRNKTQRGTQTTVLGVMIGTYSPDSQHGETVYRPANAGCSFFRYTNDDLSNRKNQRRQHQTRSRQDNKLARLCFLGATRLKSGKIVLGFRQQAKDSLTKLGR